MRSYTVTLIANDWTDRDVVIEGIRVGDSRQARRAALRLMATPGMWIVAKVKSKAMP